MGGLKVRVRQIYGLEKHFTSLTMAIDEMIGVLGPKADIAGIMSTPVGESMVSYTLQEWSDTNLGQMLRLMPHTDHPWTGKDGKVYKAAEVSADRGHVSVVSRFGYAFGWEPNKKKGGFNAHIETWPERVFNPLAGPAARAKAMLPPWTPIWEVGHLTVRRRMGVLPGLPAESDKSGSGLVDLEEVEQRWARGKR